MIKELIDFD